MQLLTFWQGKCQWLSIEQSSWHDSLYFVLPGKYRYSSLIISRSGYSGPHSLPGSDLSSPRLSLFWARLRLSETQSDIFILKACLFSGSDNHHSPIKANIKQQQDHQIMKARCRYVFINFEILIKLLVRFPELLAAAEKSKHLENREFEINPHLGAWFRKWATLCKHLRSRQCWWSFSCLSVTSRDIV